jgi:single-strand DNA-binding protein
MSEGLNRVILLGHIGADPDLRYTASGAPVLNLRLATNETYVDRSREVQVRTDWHQVVIWGARAEGLAKVLAKGACILVEGSLRTSSYEKDGSKRYKTEVHAREICLASRRPQPQPQPQPAVDNLPDEALAQIGAATLRNGTAVRAEAVLVGPDGEPIDELPY